MKIFHLRSLISPGKLQKANLRRSAVIALLMTITMMASSQNITVRGTVTTDKGTPVQGASVIIKGTSPG